MLIIFDLDGVLLGASWRGLFEAYKEMISVAGKDYRKYFTTFREFKEWWSPDWQENIGKIGIREKDLGEAHENFYRIYNSYTYLFAWSSKVVCELAKSHQLSIFTNRHSSSARTLIKPISRHFACIIGGEDVRRLKPDPEGIYRILSILEKEEENTLMIGDMPEDIIAGKLAGIKTGAVKWGLGDWKNLLAENPDYTFEKYKDLLRI